jgi:hypothetical protein
VPLTTINSAKDIQQTFQPLLVALVTFVGGSTLRLSTHPLSVAEGGFQYGGANYFGRIVEQDISIVQGYEPGGIDVIPRVSLRIADADKSIKVNYDDVYGFSGATLELTFIFWDADSATFSSDSTIKFTGICDPARHDEDTILVSATSKLNLQRRFIPSVPLQRRCPWRFPTTVAQRQDSADNEDSLFYQCGYSPDASGGNARGNYETGVTPFASCDFTKAACVARGMYKLDSTARATGRFGGIQWDPPAGSRSREYTSGNWIDVQNNPNEAKYGRPIPMVYGTAWVDAIAVNVIGDGNSTRGEAVICLGEVQGILKVVVNDVELQAATDVTGGTNYIVRDALLRYNVVNQGDRNGSPNLDTPYNGDGDPFGSMATILWVVPRRVADSASTPRVRVWVQGPKLRVYTDLVTYSRESTSNPAWVLMDLLIWAGFQYSELDIQTFIDAAAVCDVAIPYEDQYGVSSTHARYSCSMVLNQKRSAADLIRSLRQSFGAILVPNSSTGKLQVFIEGTLASQQPAAVDGSNYNTPIASQALTGGVVNGYVAYDFTKFGREGNKNTLAIETPNNAAIPNRVSFQFINSEREYAADSISVVDAAAVARIDQEVAQSLDVEGVNTIDQAKRIAARSLARGLRGNGRGDTGGSEIFTWEDSFRLIRLRAGHLVRLSSTQYGLSNVLARILQIRPSRNFERVTITAQRHSDAWFLDTYGQADDPEGTPQFRNRLDRPAFPWGPAAETPDTDDPMVDETELTWEMYQEYSFQADETGLITLHIAGRWPVNIFSPIAPPIVGRQGTTASTGGFITGGRAYYYCICSEDSDGLLSVPSLTCKVEITNVGSTNTATVPITAWPDGAVGYKLFGGDSPHMMTLQAEAASTPASVTLNFYFQRDAGCPDPEFDKMKIKVKRIFHAGVWGQPIDDLPGANEITIGGAGWTTDEWAGRICSVLGKAAEGIQPVWNFLVSSNTSETLTVTPDPIAEGVELGDALIMRSTPTVGSDGGGNYLEDLLWINSLDGGLGGLNVDEEKGRLLRIIAGPGRGDVYRIISNTATKVYIEGEWLHTPTAASIYIIEEPDWVVAQTTDSLNNSDFLETLRLKVEVTNYAATTILIQAVTVDGGGNESMDVLSPIREIYIYGEPANGPYEQANFALGMCDPLAVATDLTNRALVETDGTCFRCSVNAKEASVGARAVIDLLVSRDNGATWKSIFPDGNDNKIVVPADSTDHHYFTVFDPDWGVLEENDMIRPDVLETGTGCAKVSVKLMWRRVGGKAGTINAYFIGEAALAAVVL